MASVALGAVAMYFSDPTQGRRRRALARAKLKSAAMKASDAIDIAGRDIGNRLAGMRARLGLAWPPGRFPRQRGEAGSDEQLAARVRARIGRVVSHPHAVAALAHDGRVELSGPILAHERQHLLDSVSAVAGVAGVDDKLTIHDSPDGIPALQGEGRRATERGEQARESWTPALRSIAVMGGAALGTYGLVRRTPAGAALAVVGLALFARGAGNKPLKRMLGLVQPAEGITLQKTIDVNVPIDTVFDVWTQYENFPNFLSHVLAVRELDEERSHWVVKGPAGAELEWDAVQTACTRPSLLSWQTAPGAEVEHKGSVYFEPLEIGTRVTVRLSYHPPAGALGHGLAVMLGSDPKRQLEDDLVRMKEFIEAGIPPRHAAKPMPAPGRKSRKSMH